MKIASLYPYYEAKESLISKVAIRIDSDKVSARGYYYPDNGSVEILAGSELCTSIPNPGLYEDVELLRNELLESGIIAGEEPNMVFKTNYFVYSKRTMVLRYPRRPALSFMDRIMGGNVGEQKMEYK